MALLTPCFFDTSVLVGGIVELGPQSAPAQALMTAVAEHRLARPMTAWHCCLEFYSVTTRLPVEFRISPEHAVLLVEEEILERFDVHQLPPGQWRAFLQSAREDRVAGGRVYDAHIAEVARECRARTVVTDNRRHFTSLLRDAIRVLTADEAIGEVPPDSSVTPSSR